METEEKYLVVDGCSYRMEKIERELKHLSSKELITKENIEEIKEFSSDWLDIYHKRKKLLSAKKEDVVKNELAESDNA